MRNSVASRVLGAHLILNVVSFSSSSLKSTLKIQQDSKTLPSAETNVIMIAPFSCREDTMLCFSRFVHSIRLNDIPVSLNATLVSSTLKIQAGGKRIVLYLLVS